VIPRLRRPQATTADLLPPVLRELGEPAVRCGADGLLLAWNAPAVAILGPLLDRTPPRVAREDLV
jgi:hypothetical protein